MEVRLRKDFYGSLLPKTSLSWIGINVEFDYKGLAQTLTIEFTTGKRGLWGEYDQESPIYYNTRAVSASDVFKSYGIGRAIPLSFWGDRQIDDCAVEIKIKGQGISESAVLWNAYTVNL